MLSTGPTARCSRLLVPPLLRIHHRRCPDESLERSGCERYRSETENSHVNPHSSRKILRLGPTTPKETKYIITIIVGGLEAPNPDFQPILTTSKFQYYEARDARLLWSKIRMSLELAKNQDLGPPDLIQLWYALGFLWCCRSLP